MPKIKLFQSRNLQKFMVHIKYHTTHHSIYNIVVFPQVKTCFKHLSQSHMRLSSYAYSISIELLKLFCLSLSQIELCFTIYIKRRGALCFIEFYRVLFKTKIGSSILVFYLFPLLFFLFCNILTKQV